MKKFIALFCLAMIMALPAAALAADTAKVEGVQANPEFYAKANKKTDVKIRDRLKGRDPSLDRRPSRYFLRTLP